MRKSPFVPLFVIALAASLPALAQEAPAMTAEEQAMMAAFQRAGTPGPQHAAMAESQGNYTLKVVSWQAPDAPPAMSDGKATRRMDLGGRILIEELESSVMGETFTGIGMHGYDNVSGEYWATWNDSMSTGLMVSKGSCDDDGSCRFTGSWNDPVSKDKVHARMTTRWTDANTEIFEMYGPGPDGKEMKMMQITYTRVSS